MNSSLISKPRRETRGWKLDQITKDGYKKTNWASKNNIRRTKYELSAKKKYQGWFGILRIFNHCIRRKRKTVSKTHIKFSFLTFFVIHFSCPLASTKVWTLVCLHWKGQLWLNTATDRNKGVRPLSAIEKEQIGE